MSKASLGGPIVTAFLIELYGDDGKRKKEKMALKFINKYILTPIRRWLMKRRASIERERIKKNAWRLNSAREYEEKSKRRSSERRSSQQGSLVDFVREESAKRPRRLPAGISMKRLTRSASGRVGVAPPED